MTPKLHLDSRDIDGAWVTPRFLNPYAELSILDALDGDQLCSPAEEMDGEVRPPVCYLNHRTKHEQTAGPAWSQIITQDDEDEYDEEGAWR